MPDALTIRRYQCEDWGKVVELHRLALQQVGAYSDDRSVDADLNHIDEIYIQDHGEFLVGECDGQVVAIGALRRTTCSRAEIKRMRVHPDYQQRGFGQAILNTLEHRARELGYTELHLDTTVQQTAAQRLYEKNRYALVREGTLGGFNVRFYEKKL
jgi:ribosomal protein S18 acetylase RimI-like enzyme